MLLFLGMSGENAMLTAEHGVRLVGDYERELEAVRSSNERLRKLIEERLRDPRRQRILQLRRRRAQLAVEVGRLGRRAEEGRRRAEAESFGQATEAASQRRLEGFHEATLRDLSTCSLSLWTRERELRGLMDAYSLRRSQLEDRNAALLDQLLQLLPLRHSPDVAYGLQVASAVVPREGDLSLVSRDGLPHVLSAVVRLLLLLASWLELPFPRRMRYRSSRSLLSRPLDPDMARPLCLWPGVDNGGSFEAALRALQKNVAFLSAYAGLPVPTSALPYLLPNLLSAITLLRQRRPSHLSPPPSIPSPSALSSTSSTSSISSMSPTTTNSTSPSASWSSLSTSNFLSISPSASPSPAPPPPTAPSLTNPPPPPRRTSIPPPVSSIHYP